MYGDKRRRGEREEHRPRRYEEEGYRPERYREHEQERYFGSPERRRQWEQEGRKIEEGYHPELYTDPRFERERREDYYEPRRPYREEGRERYYPPPQDFRGESRWYPEPYRRGYQTPAERDERWMRDAGDFRNEGPRERPRRHERPQWEDEGSAYGTYDQPRRGDRRPPEYLRNEQGYQERFTYDRPIGPGYGGRQQGYERNSEDYRERDERYRGRHYGQPETYEQVPQYRPAGFAQRSEERPYTARRPVQHRSEESPAARKMRQMDREERHDRRANREAQLNPQGTHAMAARSSRSYDRPRRGGAVVSDSSEEEIGGS